MIRGVVGWREGQGQRSKTQQMNYDIGLCPVALQKQIGDRMMVVLLEEKRVTD